MTGRTLLVAGALLCSGSLHAAVPSIGPAPPALPPVLPAHPEAKEPFFSIILGMVEEDVFGVVPIERLKAEIARHPNPTRIPLGPVRQFVRLKQGGNPDARMQFLSDGDVKVPIPYSILGYHPGKIRGSSVIDLFEWNLGNITIDPGVTESGERGPAMELENVTLWGISQGYFEVDLDGWVDAILGSKMDDTRVVGFALLRHEGKLVGLSMGYTKKGTGSTGLFDFGKDEIVYPLAPEYRAAGRYLRGRLEHLMPGLRRFRS